MQKFTDLDIANLIGCFRAGILSCEEVVMDLTEQVVRRAQVTEDEYVACVGDFFRTHLLATELDLLSYPITIAHFQLVVALADDGLLATTRQMANYIRPGDH